MKKISFDFDSTLSEKHIQKFASKLIELGFDVWITTSRFPNKIAKKKNWWWVIKNNQELFDVANNLNIQKKNIIFTNGQDKINFLKNNNFLFHLDDDNTEIELINESDDICIGIWTLNNNWKKECKKILNIKYIS